MSERKRSLPEINAGSMADIAFLLLIFFLVTTTMDIDSGILKKIPPKEEHPTQIDIHRKNILEVSINRNDEIYVGDAVVELSNLKEIALNFIDNGAGFDFNEEPCNWCRGKKDPTSSDHPKKAVVCVSSDRNATYETYISVLDNLNSAYAMLRNRLAEEMYNTSYNELLGQLKKETKNKAAIAQKVKMIKDKYPLLIADAEIED